MTNRSSNNQPGNGQRSPLAILIAVVVVIVGALIYQFTGVDLLGVIDEDIPPTPIVVPTASGAAQPITVGQGFGAELGFWQVYFTAPTGNRNRSTWVDGIDVPLARDIDQARSTIDIAVFQLDNEVITEALANAHERGVQVRIVADDEYGLEDDESTLIELEALGIPIVIDNRSALMHNKFVIIDGIVVWTGSLNFTMNGVYRNNNNLIRLRSRAAVQLFQSEFNEMFEAQQFGPRSPEDNQGALTQDNTPIEIYFASEGDVILELVQEVNNAQSEIRVLVFSFTNDALGEAILDASERGVQVEAIFETTGSETRFSEMGRLLCEGLDMRQDGNAGIMHHKVILIDGNTVVTGSFNFTDSATESNDENLLIMRDADMYALFLAEYERVKANASRADINDIDCAVYEPETE